MRFGVVCALALASAGCHVVEAAPPRSAPAAEPGPTAERLDLNLPGPAPDPAYVAAAAEVSSEIGYPLPDGRVLLHDRYRDRIAVLDRGTGQRVELGEATLLAVPRLGWLILPKGQAPGRYFDVDPRAARLRLLWEAPQASDAAWYYSDVAGVDRGAPLLIGRAVRRTAGQPDAPDPAVQLVRLRGPGAAEVRSLPLPAGLWVASADAVRGRRLLLVDASQIRGPARATAFGAPLAARVSALDLDSHALRELGEAVGAWSETTAVPHPYVAVRWSDHDPRISDHWWGAACVNVVDVASLAIARCQAGAAP